MTTIATLVNRNLTVVFAVLCGFVCTAQQLMCQQSSVRSTGIAGVGSSQAVDSMWYVGSTMQYSSPTSIFVAPVDARGNITSAVSSSDIQTRLGCSNGGPWVQIPTVGSLPSIARRLSVAICIDRTASMEPFKEYVDFAVQNILRTLSPDDFVTIIEFDHRIWNTFEGRAWDVANTYAPGETQDGLNALYRASYTGLNRLETSLSGQSERLMFVFSSGREQASVLYTLNDVAQFAAESNTRVYPFLLGYGGDSYPMRYLAEVSGGVLYQVQQHEKELTQHLARSTILGMQYGLELRIENAGQDASQTFVCPGKLTLRCSAPTTQGETSLYAPGAVEFVRWPARHQLLCTFPEGSSRINEIYYEHLNFVADILNENRDKTVLLTGHATLSGSDGTNRSLGLQRANSIKKYLVQRGISPGQIRVKSRGSELPLFQVVGQAWQEEQNRRVEIRWLDPTLFPYELIASTHTTESQALSSVNTWTSRGYNAYCVPIRVHDTMKFQIRIWGYDSYPSALAESARIKREFNISTTVD